MTPEQQAAFINAQAACVVAMVAALQARNAADMSAGRTPTHGPQDFEDLINAYGIHQNAVLGFFR